MHFSKPRHLLGTFCESTTLHGFKYFIDPRSRLSDKIFWGVSLTVSLILSILLIHQLFTNFARNPIVIVIDDIVIPVSEINFPAVSICMGLKLAVSGITLKYEKYMKNFNYYKNQAKIEGGRVNAGNFTDVELKYLQIIALITGEHEDFLNSLNVSIPTDDLLDLLRTFPLFWQEPWHGHERKLIERDHHEMAWLNKFEAQFNETLSSTGLCFTFNLLSFEEMFHEERISSDFNSSNYVVFVTSEFKTSTVNSTPPLRTISLNLGLSGRFRQYIENNFIDKMLEDDLAHFHASEKLQGYRFVIHHPWELPSPQHKSFYLLAPNFVSEFLILPSSTNIDESLMNYSPQERNCYLPHEKPLKYFQVYTKINCDHECLANKTLERCGCVQFYQVRSNKTRICGVNDSKCFNSVDQNPNFDCQCLESCEKLSYDVGTVFRGIDGEVDRKSSFTIKFSSEAINPLTRKQQLSNVEFISFVGGLLGLFAGYSFISTVEFFYFGYIAMFGKSCNSNESNVTPLVEVSRRRRPRKIFVIDFGKKFLGESSIHSFTMMASEKTVLRKFFWMLIFVLSIVTFQFMATKYYKVFVSSSIGLMQSYDSSNVNAIPFPAVTIFGDTTRYAFEYPISISPEEKCTRYLWNVIHSAICNDQVSPFFSVYGRFNGATVNCTFAHPSVMMKAFNFAHMSHRRDFIEKSVIAWNHAERPELTEILTRTGTNFVFNIKPADEILNVDTVSKDFLYNATNNRILTTLHGEDKGLEMTIFDFELPQSAITSEFEWCRPSFYVVHSPDDHPSFFGFEDLSFFTREMTVDLLIVPEVMITDESLRSFSAEARSCYFDDEFKLKYFKKYTMNNCLNECTSDDVYSYIGCVSFFSIRNETMELCGLFSKNVAHRRRKAILDLGSCRQCLPLCNEVKYKLETVILKHTGGFDNATMSETANVRIRFKNEDFQPLMRYQLLTFKDFLSNVGGLLGLVAGISSLSVVETLYFLTLRFVVDLYRHFKKIQIT